MKKEKTSVNPILKATISMMVKRTSDDWPPKCAGLLYQPQRPVHGYEKGNTQGIHKKEDED